MQRDTTNLTICYRKCVKLIGFVTNFPNLCCYFTTALTRLGDNLTCNGVSF
ncbi:hypothetical protein SAMN06295998_105144 [Primorskyibacter flagellatus]|uniref:Uncharacterized protein n=1 Tax=Primorskyibacter flagellatus TaxID=1387277 RepID=A0A1W2BZ90_9RHOB|nr:hypothetical protein SAMN06295998_105144 [Primorskyibacter flagellatus]